jgi:hypothetical protein
MALSIHDAFVPSARQIVAASIGLIDKAEAHCAEHGVAPAELIEARLAPDMFGLPFQVYSVAGHTAGALAAVKAGRFSPGGPMASELSFATLRSVLVDAQAALAAVDASELETHAGKTVVFAFGATEMPFTAENFLLSFSQPNFYFHAATLYDILRHKGVKLGKRDFMGMPRVGV